MVDEEPIEPTEILDSDELPVSVRRGAPEKAQRAGAIRLRSDRRPLLLSAITAGPVWRWE
jgi:hypothetical protein